MGVLINEDRIGVITFTLDTNITATNTTQEVDITIPGLKLGDFVMVNKPSHSTGIGITNARVKAADTLSVQFVNATGSGVDPASEVYTLLVVRGEKVVSGRFNP